MPFPLRSDIEIMAPAGSMEALSAAIRAGADSVYFGAGGLNMRSASSANFSLTDLRRISGIASRAGVRSYLTVNSVLYDGDLQAMREVLDAALDAKISAVIVSDQAAIAYAASIGMELHLSNQLNISNLESLRFYASYADVALLARELNLIQVGAIHQAVEKEKICGPSGKPIRIELFVHGALCMAISGKCYLSLHLYDKSANRGECLQACRRTYSVTDTVSGEELRLENEYIMSPKDLKTIHFMDRILSSGARVLKIEGRARSPEYVKTTVECYREAVESVVDGSYGPDKIKDWDERLARVFNRGFQNGYYLGQRLGEWTGFYGSIASRKRAFVGTCTNYYRHAGIAAFMVTDNAVSPEEELLIVGSTTGALELCPSELWVNGKSAFVAERNDEVSFAVDRKVRSGDKLYKLVPRPDTTAGLSAVQAG